MGLFIYLPEALLFKLNSYYFSCNMNRTPDQMLAEMQKLYEKYVQFRDNGTLKMRRKLTKENTEEYEFQFSNYTYYYDSPPNLLNFESPDTQKEFAAQIVAFCEEDFTKYTASDPDQQVHDQLCSIIANKNNFKDSRQILYQHFATKFQNCQDRQAFLLRAQKRLMGKERISEMDRCIINGQLQRNAIERKSYQQKLVRISEAIQPFKIGKQTAKRVTPKPNQEGKSCFFMTPEQISCSPLQKTDFVSYARSKLRDQRILLNITRIKEEIKFTKIKRWSEIQSKKLSLLKQVIDERRKQQQKMYNYLYDTIFEKIKQSNKAFIDDEQKMDKLRQYCRNATPLRTQQIKQFADLNECHCIPKWIPFLQYQFEDLVRKACKLHLSNSLMDLSNDAELYYVKMSNYISVEYRHLNETFRYIYGNQQRKQEQDRATERMIKVELEEIFEGQTTGQLIKELHRKVRTFELSTVSWDHLFSYTKRSTANEELAEDLLNQQNFFDPTIKSLIKLIDGSEQQFRSFTRTYTKRINEIKGTRFRTVKQSQYYKRVCEKQRLLQIIMKHFNKIKVDDPQLTWDQFFGKFITAQFSNNLLEISYNLIFTKMIELRNKLIYLLNAQNCLEKNVVSGLSQISHSKVPFEFTEAFTMKFSNLGNESQEKYKASFPKDQNCNPQSLQEQDQIKEVEAREESSAAPDVYVIGNNRLDSSKCFGNYVLYPKTLKEYHKLMDKLQKICSYFIELHENNLPQSDFTEMCDRYVMLHSLMEWEVKLQYKKFQLMQKYYYICKHTVNYKSLYQLYEKMMDIKHIQYIINTENNHFEQSYKLAVDKLDKQCILIERLTTLLMRIETQDNGTFASQTQTQNMSNEIPEMSVNYYSIQSNLAKNSQVSDNFLDRRSLASDGNEDRIVYSAHPTNSLYEVNQYLLKNNLADILEQNEERIPIGSNKREELIGFHEKPFFSDSLLGCPFWFVDSRQCLQQLQTKEFDHLWRIIEIIDLIDNSNETDVYKVAYYSQAIAAIESYEQIIPQSQNLLHQGLLGNYLDQAAKSTCSLEVNIQKMNFHRLSLNFDVELLKAIKLKQNYDLIKYRGLYLCMNFMEAIRLNSIMTSNRVMIEFYTKTIIQLMTEYSPASSDLSHFFTRYTFEKCGLDEDSLVNYHFPSQTPHELLFNEHLNIFRTNVMYEFTLCEFFKQVTVHMYRKINSYNLAKAQAETLLNHKMSFTAKKVASTFDMVDLANRLQSLKRSEKSLFSKTDMLYYMQLKDHALRHPKAFHRVKVVNIESLIQEKEILQQRVYLAKCKAYCLYRLGESFRFDYYLLELRDNAKKFTQVLPFIKNSIILNQQRLVSSLVEPEQPSNYTSLSKLIFPQIARFHQDVTSETAETKKLFDKVFPFEITPQIDEQSQSQYESLKRKVKRYILSLTADNFTSNLKENERRIINKRQKYQMWSAIVGFISNWIVELSLSCTKSQQMILRSNLIHGKSLSLLVFDDNSAILTRQNILVLRRICQSSKLLEMCEAQYENQDNLKKVYSQFLRDLRDYADMSLNVQKGTDQATIEHLCLENRVRQKQIYIALRQRSAKNAQAHQVLYSMFNPQQQMRLIFKQTGVEPEQSYAFASFDYNLLEKKYFSFQDYRKMRELFLKSPVSLSEFIQTNYCGKIHHKKQIDIFTKMKSLSVLDIQDRKVISDRLSELTLISNMYNIVKSSSNRQMEILDLYYQGLRMRDLCSSMDVVLNITNSEGLNRKLMEIQALIFNKSVKLNKIQTVAMEYSKSLENAKYYESMSQRIGKLIADKKMYEVEFEKDKFRRAAIDYSQQLKLLQYLHLDAERLRLITQEKVRKQLVNMVIVPQIKINPFLSSPLCLQKYFLPHTAKLAYIQSFLNKLRNKVLQVELIDEQFGFLIKTKDLEECVGYLCKTFLSFSEKQFAIRTRSLTSQVEALQGQITRTKSQLQDQKNRNIILRDRASGLLNSLVISKTTSLLVEFFNMKGRWDDMLRIVKAMESQQAQQAKNMFIKEIDGLKCQSSIIKDQYNKFKQLLSNVFKNDIEQSKITLEKKFVQKIEEVLGTAKQEPTKRESMLKSRQNTINRRDSMLFRQPNPQTYQQIVLTKQPSQKQIFSPAIQHKYTQQQQELESKRYEQCEVYLKKMAKQRAFYLLKISSIQTRHQKEVEYFKSQLASKDKIQNSYFLQKKKCDSILQQLNTVNDKIKSYEATIQELNRQTKIDENTKEKLCRINEALNLKCNTLQAQYKAIQLPPIIQTPKQNPSIGIQTAAEPNSIPRFAQSEHKPFNINIQKGKSSDFRYQAANEFSVWREKYDSLYVKHNDLMKSITQIHETVHVCKELGRFDILLNQISELPRQEGSGAFNFKDFEVSLKPQSRAHTRHRRLKTTVIPEQHQREL